MAIQVGRNRPALGHPARRRLRTYAFDPLSTRLAGRFLTVDVPFEEQLRPGPSGALVQVVDRDAARDRWYEPVDLDDPVALATDGLRPSAGDPRSHQQVVYAVAMAVIDRFEQFLGRRFRWRADTGLRLVPHAFEGRNAFFDPSRRAVLFGYYRAETTDPGANLPGQMIFTCLSSDIVAHEVTHALLHRLRPYFNEATNLDVFAWHEAFADLIALFQHFAYRDIVTDAVAETAGDLRKGAGLLDLAREFGESIGRGKALRSAIDDERTPARFRAATEPHERGACFVSAVFDAFLDTFRAATADLLRIASGGTGVLPAGRLHPDLVARLAGEAVATANRILGMVVRAIDYLPVVDPTFGDVLRAVVTADRDLFPDDTGRLRATLVESLRRRGIYPDQAASLTDEDLVWPRPDGLRLVDGGRAIDLAPLILAATQDLDPSGEAGESLRPGESVGPDDAGSTVVRRLARDLARWGSAHCAALGLEPTLPCALHGMHVTYQAGADHQVRPQVILQFTQRRPDLQDGALPAVRAATTVVAGVDGRVRYLVTKPLPAPDAAGGAGSDRLAAMGAWAAQTEADDPVSPWTGGAAVERLTFASMHAAAEAAVQ